MAIPQRLSTLDLRHATRSGPLRSFAPDILLKSRSAGRSPARPLVESVMKAVAPGVQKFLPPVAKPGVAQLRAAAATCEGCDLYKNAEFVKDLRVSAKAAGVS